MIRTKTLLLLSLFLICGKDSGAQDPQFSQFYAAPLYMGPSFAGSANMGRLILNYRDQWPKLAGRFLTYAVSYDQFIPSINSGAGIMILHDNSGSGKLTTTRAGLNYSYRIQAARNLFIQPGLQMYYYQRKIDFEKLVFSDQYFGETILPVSRETPPEMHQGHVDFTTSLLVYTDMLWAGASFDHLMRLNNTISEDLNYLPLRISIYGGLKIDLYENILNREEQHVTFAFNFKNQANISQLDLGAYYFRAPFRVGLWYRGIPVMSESTHNDAFIVSAGLLHNQLSLSYSYDVTISNLITSTGGAHEIVLMYNFNAPDIGNMRNRIGAVPCPQF